MYRALLVLIACLWPVYTVSAAGWDLAKNVKRLERLAPDYADDKEIDKKFLDVLDLTETTRKESEVYEEGKRIAGNMALVQSKYMDSFLYYMLVRSIDVQKEGVTEIDIWLNPMKSYENSPHLLPAQLIRLARLPKDSLAAQNQAEAIVTWLKARKPDYVVRAPEWSGNILMGYKPRMNFAEGEVPKLFKASYYKSSAVTLGGYQDDETYVALLDRYKAKREDVLNEMVEIYKKYGKRKEAAEIYYQLAQIKVTAKDFKEAAVQLDNAVKQNPEHLAAKKELDRIKLELTYQSLNPQPPKPAETPATPPAEAAPAQPAEQAPAAQ